MGYKTIAIGKWHLPLDHKENMPSYQGFQVGWRSVFICDVMCVFVCLKNNIHHHQS
jgi:hypothetical protein